MEKQIISLFEDYIENLYQQARSILSDESSYYIEGRNLHCVNLYLTFLEASLHKPYNRLYSLSSFVEDEYGLLVHQMYPFAMLSDNAKACIKKISIQAVQMATALDKCEIDPDYKSLITEDRIEINPD